MDKDLRFIARHYRKGMFKTEAALRRIKGTKTIWWTRTRIAAACTIAAILTATAAVFVHQRYLARPAAEPEQTQSSTIPATQTIRTIDFENAPLPTVVEKIREVYGVEVVDMPADAAEYSLSLHYTGSARDLVEAINDILDTDMKIQE